jgi:hypothetical protein
VYLLPEVHQAINIEETTINLLFDQQQHNSSVFSFIPDARKLNSIWSWPFLGRLHQLLSSQWNPPPTIVLGSRSDPQFYQLTPNLTIWPGGIRTYSKTWRVGGTQGHTRAPYASFTKLKPKSRRYRSGNPTCPFGRFREDKPDALLCNKPPKTTDNTLSGALTCG